MESSMANQNQKKKLLCLMKILLENTDEKHIMSAADLCTELEKYDVSAERKAIYNDIAVLQEFGLDIEQSKGRRPGYYIASREFELAELKLLVDAVQASKFITSKKSAELIRKLEHQASKHDAQYLRRDVFIYNRPKSVNETIYYNVDLIHAALRANSKITYQYAEWTTKKELKLKKDGAFYVVSPWALTWDDENYYLIAYDEAADTIKHYRVDKMQKMSVLEEERVGKQKFQDFDLAAFAKKTFSMYGGHDETVTLVCKNNLAGVVLDRFGTDVMMMPMRDGYFKVKTLVAVSPQFFGWVTGIGDGMEIAGPEHVREEYKEYLENLLGKYGDRAGCK